MIADPVAAVQSFGPSLGAVIVCVSVFIWSQIQFNAFGRDLRQHMQDDEQSFSDLKNLTVGGMNQQNQLAVAVRDMANAVKKMERLSAR